MQARTRFATIVLVAGVMGIVGCSSKGSLGAEPDRSTTTRGPASTTTAPSGGRQSDVDPGRVIPCDGADPLTWKVAPARTTALQTIRDRHVPFVPGTQPIPRDPSSEVEFSTVDEFIDQADLKDPEGRRAVMQAAGFTHGIESYYDVAEVPFHVQALEFRDPAAAATYASVHAKVLCDWARGPVHALSADGGVAYRDESGSGHALFVFGSDEVMLDFCPCPEGADHAIERMRQWYEDWVTRDASGPARSVT